MRLGIGLSEESLDAEMAQARSGSPWVSLSETYALRTAVDGRDRNPGADQRQC
jgi:hypothetical protein